MMKLNQVNTKLILLLCLLGLAQLQAKAQKRTEQDALEIAKAFLQEPQVANEGFRSSLLHSKRNYYIINDKDGEGFALISALREAKALIAYSPSSQIKENVEGEIPEGLAYLLAAYDDYYKQKKGELRTVANERYRRDFYYPRPVVAPLLDCQWNQFAPYNDDCPKISGALPPAGCVAIAIGQIMYYHKFPEQPKGKVAYKLSATGQMLERDFSLSNYDWSLILPTYEQVAAKSKESASLSRLIADLGLAVRMDYQLGASGAKTSRAAKALEEYFNYKTQIVEAKELAQKEFLQYIKTELDNKFPLYMEGTSNQGAHAWVVDGYDNSGLLHINWGWGGMSNGYFDLSILNPAQRGAEFALGVNSGFNRNVAILLMHPKKEGLAPLRKIEPALSIAWEGYFRPKKEGRKAILKTSEDFIVSLNGIYNQSKKSFEAYCGIGLYDKEGQRIKVFKPQDESRYKRYYQSGISHVLPLDFNCELKGLAEGEYELRPIGQVLARNEEPEQWRVFRGSKPIKIKMLSQEELQVLDYADEQVHLISTRQPEEIAISKQGQKGRISLRLENNSYSRAWGKLQMLFYKQNPKTKEAEGKALDKLTISELRLAPFETFDRDIVYEPTLPAGKYIVKFQLKEESNLYQNVLLEGENQLAIELHDASHQAWLQLTSLGCYAKNGVFQSDVIELDKDLELAIGCRIANVSGLNPFNGKITFYLMDMADDSLISLFELRPTILPSEDFSNFASMPHFSPKEIGLQRGHTYRLVIKVQGEGREEALDLWTADSPRRYFSIEGKAEEKTKEEDKPKTEEPASLGNVEECFVKVYPNPFNLYLKIDGLSPCTFLKIYNIKGRLVFQKYVSLGDKLCLELGNLAKGKYLLVLRNKESRKKQVIRLIK